MDIGGMLCSRRFRAVAANTIYLYTPLMGIGAAVKSSGRGTLSSGRYEKETLECGRRCVLVSALGS